MAFDLSGTPWRRLEMQRGVWCLVDAEDWPWIIERRWNAGWHCRTPWKFYAKRNIGAERSTVYLHREILTRLEPARAADHWGDHANGQSLDNRRCNLRWLTPTENRRHQIKRHQVPSLDHLVAQLLAHVAMPGEVPFDTPPALAECA